MRVRAGRAVTTGWARDHRPGYRGGWVGGWVAAGDRDGCVDRSFDHFLGLF